MIAAIAFHLLQSYSVPALRRPINQLFRMSETPGRIRWPGRPHGHDTAAVLAELGVDDGSLADLRARGVA